MVHKVKSEFVPLEFKPASAEQQFLAKQLDINVEGNSWDMARAKILDAVGGSIGEPIRVPTSGQFELAVELGLNIEGDSFRVAFAKIAEHLTRINIQAVNDQKLSPGDQVVGYGAVHEISSISSDGHLYFKGIGCPQCPAGKCARCDDNALGIMLTRLEMDPEAQSLSILNCVAALNWTVKNREITLSEKVRLIELGGKLGGLLESTLRHLHIFAVPPPSSNHYEFVEL